VYQTEETDWPGAEANCTYYLPVIGYWDRVVFSDDSKVEIGLINASIFGEKPEKNGSRNE